jgi:hypothetical protein
LEQAGLVIVNMRRGRAGDYEETIYVAYRRPLSG